MIYDILKSKHCAYKQELQKGQEKVELLIETKYSFMYYPNIERHIINVIKNRRKTT